jgi:hypothetical protein
MNLRKKLIVTLDVVLNGDHAHTEGIYEKLRDELESMDITVYGKTTSLSLEIDSAIIEDNERKRK